MTKIVINKCYGGFGLSEEALETLGIEYAWEIDRSDPRLVELVEKGDVDVRHSELKVVEVPDGTDWVIEEYDGMEWVAERHQTWH